MEFQEYIFIFAWFMAGFIHGIGGTGAAMVAVPIITSLMPAETLIPVTCGIAVFISCHVAWLFREGCVYPTLKTLLVGAVPGSCMGLALLLFIPTYAIQLLTGLVMLFFVFWHVRYAKHQMCHVKQAKRAERAERAEFATKNIMAGGVAGILNTSISFGNPAVGMYTLSLGYSPAQIIGTTNVFSVFGYVLACMTQGMAGLFTQEVLVWVAYGVPASLLGIALASPLARRISSLLFKRILLIILSLGGSMCLWRGLQGAFY